MTPGGQDTGDPSPAGRANEVRRIERFVLAPAGGTRALVLRGDAGIGKSVLWWHGVAAARAGGRQVLTARAAEDERSGHAVGLTDLFDLVERDGVVLDADADPFDRGRGVLRTLRRLAEEAPVVVGVDDVHWLDPVTARVLRYAARRLDREDVRFLLTRVDEAGGADAAGVGGEPGRGSVRPDASTLDLPPGRTEDLTVGPLDRDALRRVLSSVTDVISRPELERVHALTGGNPRYALEVVRSGATVELDDRLGGAVGPTLRRAVAWRLAGAPNDVLAVATAAAALGPVPLDVLCAGARRGPQVVADAIDRELLEVDHAGTVRFAHPLLASVVLEGTNVVDRRALHGRLAAVVSDPDGRARHLALALVEPDGDAADELEAAARRAGRQGAAALAAELAAHSARLTPHDDVATRTRRELAEVFHWAAAGEVTRAIERNDGLLARLPWGGQRAEALAQRVVLDFSGAAEVLSRALDEAAGDDALRGRILDLRAYVALTYEGDLAGADRLAQEAMDLARDQGDEELEMTAAGSSATAALLAGRPRPELMRRALALAERSSGPRLGRWPSVFRARHCLWAGELAEARDRFERLREASRRSGIEFQRPYRLHDLALLEVATGRLAVAARLVDDGLEAARDAGYHQAEVWLAYPEGLIHAHLGSADRARQAADRLARWASKHHELPRLMMAHHVAGLAALAGGDAASALTELGAGVALADGLGYAHPGAYPLLPDAIEAAAVAGDPELAGALVARLDAQAAALGVPRVRAAAVRARGLVASADGDAEGADRLAAAVDAFTQLGCELDAGRAALWHGRALLREGRRNAAADASTQARDRLRALGAVPWAAQAEADLERAAPGRSSGDLTVTERRVAELVVAGRRNREIAAELYVSVATVEAHLTRMYRKLGVRSRTELARVVAPPADPSTGPPAGPRPT